MTTTNISRYGPLRGEITRAWLRTTDLGEHGSYNPEVTRFIEAHCSHTRAGDAHLGEVKVSDWSGCPVSSVLGDWGEKERSFCKSSNMFDEERPHRSQPILFAFDFGNDLLR